MRASRSELVRSIREASQQYEALAATEHKAARDMVRQRLAALRRQLATYDEHHGMPANEDLARPWQFVAVAAMVALITAALLHSCGALIP